MSAAGINKNDNGDISDNSSDVSNGSSSSSGSSSASSSSSSSAAAEASATSPGEGNLNAARQRAKTRAVERQVARAKEANASPGMAKVASRDVSIEKKRVADDEVRELVRLSRERRLAAEEGSAVPSNWDWKKTKKSGQSRGRKGV